MTFTAQGELIRLAELLRVQWISLVPLYKAAEAAELLDVAVDYTTDLHVLSGNPEDGVPAPHTLHWVR